MGSSPKAPLPKAAQPPGTSAAEGGTGTADITGPITPSPTPVLPSDDDECEPGLYPVTYVAEFEAAGEWPFARGRKRIVIGGSRRREDRQRHDIAIPERGLSGTHCLLERRANSIRIYDLGSTNGTYVGSSKIETSWDVRIGDKFSPKPLTLFLMDDVMQGHRGMLFEILGTGFPPSPDMLLTEVVRQASPVIIVGDEGCGQDLLARAIHDMSPRRNHQMLTIADIPADRAAQSALIRQASKPKTTAVLLIKAKRGTPPLDPQFVSSLYSPSYGVRVIALATSEEDVEHALPKQQLHQSYHISLRPLAFRAGEIEQLLDRMFAARGCPDLRTADLLPENQEALRAYGWPKNLTQLGKVADAIVAHEKHGGVRPASRALGVSPSTLHEQLERVGLVVRSVPGSERKSLFRS